MLTNAPKNILDLLQKTKALTTETLSHGVLSPFSLRVFVSQWFKREFLLVFTYLCKRSIKALLISKAVEFPKTHDLLLLNNLCSAAGILLEIDQKHLNTLTDYAVRTRYPGEVPTVEDAKEALELAKLIRNLARKFLGM